MLHWFAGQKPTEISNGTDATGYVEPPETPAPVFAVRAFKHAIFGTPQTTHAKPRRHSNTEHARPRNAEAKPTRPGMNRPKSTSDTLTLAKQDSQQIEEPLSSPTKGILLTPGAAAARKKNVTFGENVVDNEEKRPLKSGLPDDCPGKFPSPWDKVPEDAKPRAESPDKGRGRSKLTEAFEQVRDESRKRKAKGDKRGKDSDDEDNNELKGEFAEPRSESGKYWKREYDIYRNNTQREVKKLITKQKAAKSYAQMKDSQCTDLADQLRQEHKRASTLEAKTAELTALITSLRSELRERQNADQKYQEEISMLKRRLGIKDVANQDRTNSVMMAPPQRGELECRVAHEHANSQTHMKQRSIEPDKLPNGEDRLNEDPVQRPSEPYNASAVSEISRTSGRTVRARSRSKPEDVQLKSTDDIWAQLDSSSNPAVAQSAERACSTLKSGYTVTSGTEATPLKALSINTLPTEPNSKRGSPPGSTPDLEKVDSKNSPYAEEQERDLPLPSSGRPLSSSEPPSTAKSIDRESITQRKDSAAKVNNRTSQVSGSSPFQYDAKTAPSRTEQSNIHPVLETSGMTGTGSKENVSPTSKSNATQDELHAKPSALWSSMNAPSSGKRNSSVTGREYKELSKDRIEAARARIAARGRVTS